MIQLILWTVCTSPLSFADPFIVVPLPACSKESEFTCENSQCIPLNKYCDGHTDCSDGSDETGCTDCQEPFWFRCVNKKCISKSFLCDNTDDCGDNSDEEVCIGQDISISVNSTCSENEWQCTDRLCIPREWVCNGEEDCLDGSDEYLVDCKNWNNNCTEFLCDNGQCIPNKWRCDKHYDCSDKSDEQDCDVLPEECLINEGLFYCNRSCIEVSRLCDGKANCLDGSDEGRFCSVFTCSNTKCSNKCVITPNGPKCVCDKGYRMTSLNQCEDIDECQRYGTCDQKCRNSQGSYKCYCDKNYRLLEDGKTCKANNGEALMIFSSQSEIRGYYLDSELYFPIAKDLNHAIGVSYDGQYVYWSEIVAGNETIIRSLEDGSHRQVLVSSGLGSPEDLAVDWITGNIYFTDAELKHIAVCTNDGMYCTVLVTNGVQRPRSIELDPLNGQMYWSDWGKRPEIARANMDGSEDIAFVSNNIYWPNGIAIDIPNQRLYWVDAKLMTVESIKLDGSDRRIIFKDVVKHPYALAVFENRIYWSDWTNQAIESSDKFTGREHFMLIKQKQDNVYGIHIYHSSLFQPGSRNPCKTGFCSDICLLHPRGYSCACPQEKVLGDDKHTCRATTKTQSLVIVTDKSIFSMTYQSLGKHNFTKLSERVKDIGAIAYNSLNHSIFIFQSETLMSMDLRDGHITPILGIHDLGHITDMDYDPLANNLYLCKTNRSQILIINLNTVSKKVILDDMAEDTPIAIALVPEQGLMFIAFQTAEGSAHIDRFRMDGRDRVHIIESDLIGPLHIIYDTELDRIFWTDSTNGIVEGTSIDGGDRHNVAVLDYSPIGIAALKGNLFWINRKSKVLHSTNKLTSDSERRTSFDVSTDEEVNFVISTTPSEIPFHPCQVNNGACSHICLNSIHTAVCACPMDMKLDLDGKRCIHVQQCMTHEFSCQFSDMCIPFYKRCDGTMDCFLNEDENDCQPIPCSVGYFQCIDGNNCIKDNLRCDTHYDCTDQSDEVNCTYTFQSPTDCSHEFCHMPNNTCGSEQFRCNSGMCIPLNWQCDQEYDCDDKTDEHNQCEYTKCIGPRYQCANGRCIDSTLKCNRVDDCGDSSDETDCFEHKTVNSTTCNKSEFTCHSSISKCVPLSARCNGTSECPKHEDEEGCLTCPIDEFQCNNGKCIPRPWVCDHVNDCVDNSDENTQLCTHLLQGLNHTTYSFCTNKFLCKNGNCLDMDLVCNGRADCEDGSDENGICSTACTADNNPCSQICKKTPVGPQCHCNLGFKLRGDGRTCSDIDECQIEPPVCSQLCNNVPGSFSCACYDGSLLRSDHRSCKSVEQGMSMIFATSNGLYQLFPANNSLEILIPYDSWKVSTIDADIKRSLIYYNTKDSICQLHLTNGSQKCIPSNGKVDLLNVEWVTGNIYFIKEDDTARYITLCNLNMQSCVNIVNIPKNERISAFIVDAVNEYIFYIQTTKNVFSSFSSQFYRSRLDGSERRLIFSSNDFVATITFNVYRRLLYFADQEKIHKLDYDGQNHTEIILNITKPLKLFIFDSHLFLYDIHGYMTVCPLFKDYQSCYSLAMFGSFTKVFVVFHQTRQPTKKNRCEASCSSLCVNNETTATCLCNSTKVNSFNSRCYITEVQTATLLKKGVGKVEESKGSSTVLVVCVIFSVIIVGLSVFVYQYLRKKRSGHLSISMRFKNPLYGYLQDNVQEITLLPGQHEYYNPISNMPVNDQVQNVKKVIF